MRLNFVPFSGGQAEGCQPPKDPYTTGPQVAPSRTDSRARRLTAPVLRTERLPLVATCGRCDATLSAAGVAAGCHARCC